MTTATATADRPLLGIALMLGFCVLAPLGDATAKLLGQTGISVPMLVFVRFAVQVAILIPLAAIAGYSLRMSPRILRFTALRTVLHIAGIGLMFSALKYLPLADAIAIAFVMPFIMMLLGHYVLGEEVGVHRKWACAVGFIGTLLVIQPNFATVGWPALLPLGVAVVFSLFMLVTRVVAKDVDAVALQAVSGCMAVVMLLPAILLLPDVGTLTSLFAEGSTHLLLLLGILGTCAHLLMTWSLRFAPSATLAPMQYLEIPIGTVVGYYVFSQFPNELAALGIAITVGAGLYIILRERAISQQTEAL